MAGAADGPVLHRAGLAAPGYAEVIGHPMFARFAPTGFFLYGGWVAVQSLWAAVGVPLSIASLVAWNWALFCVTITFVSLSRPAIGQAFPAMLAGRALSAYNLAIFSGVIALQWGIGLVIDPAQHMGWLDLSAFRGAFALLALCCTLSYLWFLCRDDTTALGEPKFPR